MNKLTYSDVIRAQEAASLNVTSVCNDLLGSTWAASYVRLIEVISTAKVSDHVNLAYIVALSRRDTDIISVISDSTFAPADSEELRQFLSRALFGLAEPDHYFNSALTAALRAIEVSLASHIQRVSFSPGTNSKARRTGPRPREEMLFKVAEKFLYLALHSES